MATEPKIERSKVKVILLKETQQPPRLYEQRPRQTDTHHSSRYSNVNRTSIAYLSSILQDEHKPNNTYNITEPVPIAQQFDPLQHFKLSEKKSTRYLSSLLQLPQNVPPKSKTVDIDRLFQRRKLLPVDKLRQRKKNISFSVKNKRQLNQDFREFCHNKTTNTEPILLNEPKETVVFPKKEKMAFRNQGGRQLKKHMRYLQSQKPLVAHIEQLKTHSKDNYMAEPGYAEALRRLSCDLPMMANFQWSRLDKDLYRMVKK